MQTNELLSLLERYPNKSLLFEYKPGQFVAPNYHVTEVKKITIDSVDCGAGTDFWKETIIQLWESPEEVDIREYMTAKKALGILKKVNEIKPLEIATEVKFEYSNTNFHTARLFVNGFEITDKEIVLKLGVERTDFKAKDTGGVPAGAVEEKEAYCAPGGSCC